MILSTLTNKENFNSEPRSCTHRKKKNSQFDTLDFITDIIVLSLSVYAAYLSWSCNTLKKMPVPLKIFNSFFAFVFGVLYVIFYTIFKGTVAPCK